MTEPAIQAKDISYAYGDMEAVKGISFEVSPGEVLGFLGPNGAGKSTTIKMLTGQLTPRSGVARILGMDVTVDNPEVQARIGVCFEEKNLYLNMSARENLRFFARLFGIKKPDVDALLEKVGLGDRGRDRVKSYSKGMRQRLMIARSLVNRPEVLFLDEPTDGLDPVSSQAVRGLIKDEVKRGAAVLLTTHDILWIGTVLLPMGSSWAQLIAKLIPIYWFITPLFQIAVEGAGLEEVWKNLLVALGIAAVMLVPTVLLGRRMQAKLATA